MEPVGLSEEESCALRQGLSLFEKILQRRDVRALRVATLLRLVELLRISQEHNTLGTSRANEDISKRHLAGFVDEEHIYGLRIVRSRPQPRGACKQADRAVCDSLTQVVVTLAHNDLWRISVLRVRSVTTSKIHSGLRRCLYGCVKEVPHHSVARRSDADSLAQPHQLDGHSSAGEGLA